MRTLGFPNPGGLRIQAMTSGVYKLSGVGTNVQWSFKLGSGGMRKLCSGVTETWWGG